MCGLAEGCVSADGGGNGLSEVENRHRPERQGARRCDSGGGGPTGNGEGSRCGELVRMSESCRTAESCAHVQAG